MSSAISRGRRSAPMLAVFTVVVASLATAQDAPTDKGNDAREKVRQVYKADYAKLDTPAAKEKLARKLIGVANRFQKDPAKYDALLDEAVELGTAAGSISVVLGVADARFPAGTPENYAYKEEVFQKLGAAELDNKQRLAVADQLSETIKQAVRDAQYAAAQQLAQVAFELSGKLPGAVGETRKEAIQADLVQLEGLVKLAEQVAEARETLKASSDDEPANQLVGAYLCFVAGDWQSGSPYLQRGGGELARLAVQEDNLPKEGKALLKLGDDWFAQAEESQAVYRSALFELAAANYRRCERMVFGADRERVTKQLAAIAKEPAGLLAKPGAPNLTGAPVVAALNPAPATPKAKQPPTPLPKPPASPLAAGGKKEAEPKPADPKDPKKKPVFTLVQAVYGSERDNIDLTKRLKDASKDGLLAVFVQHNMTADKKYGNLYLRLKFGEKIVDQTVGYGKLAFLDARTPITIEGKELKVLDAIYGAGIWGEPSMVDVKDHLIGALDKHPPGTQARWLLLGVKDPVFGVPKVLIIRYAIDGKVFLKSFEEGQPVNLTPMNQAAP